MAAISGDMGANVVAHPSNCDGNLRRIRVIPKGSPMARPLHPTALVTGGNRGIGLAIASGLVAKGCAVTIGARDEAEGRAAAAAIGCAFARVDLKDPDSYFAAITAAGGFDILVNNAGILRDVSLLSPDSDFDACIEVMLAAPLDLIRLNVPHWRASGWGRIVNLSSGWGSFAEGIAGPGAYGVAKAALNALTKALPRDLPPGVKVNACDPGWVRTRMGGPAAPKSPEDGADTAVWLALLPDDGPTGGFFRNRKPAAW
jgi:NAD(P)-dependent dehydrogenase (short-subunit alcohol dehydrogenase family)